ncbi:hypothetical protein I4U23_011673 [Adineta vaga]|nr:hypothetical protein I4U23_011673 [Adineta vaga]
MINHSSIVTTSRSSFENLTLHIQANNIVSITICEVGNGYPAVIIGHYVARGTDLDYSHLLVHRIVVAAGEQQYQNDSSLNSSLERVTNVTIPEYERLVHL